MTDSSSTQNDPLLASLPADNQPAQPVPSAAQLIDSNPLDALEQILKEAKAKAGSEAPVAAAPATPSPDKQAVDEAAKKAELAVLGKERDAVDQISITEQLANLRGVVEMPAYQARVAQDEAKKQQDDSKQEQADKFAIHQLGHTKL